MANKFLKFPIHYPMPVLFIYFNLQIARRNSHIRRQKSISFFEPNGAHTDKTVTISVVNVLFAVVPVRGNIIIRRYNQAVIVSYMDGYIFIRQMYDAWYRHIYIRLNGVKSYLKMHG